MENDLNYYQPSYHQTGGPPGAMKHSSSSDPYQRPRPMPGGTVPAGASMSHPPSHHSSYPSSQGDPISYSSRAQTTGLPLRKPVMDNVGSAGSGIPPMLRDYQYEHSGQYDESKKPASQQHSSNMGGYPSRSSYLHDEPSSHSSKYDIHSTSAVGRAHVGYPSEDVPVSKLPSYSGAGSGMPHSSRDTINSFERDLARELEPPMRERSSMPPVSTLEKYFSSDEIKRFNEYNRFLVMSSPGRQKKFYNSLTTAEFNRFCDFVDFDTKSKITASFKTAPPPPIPSAVAPPPIPSAYDGHNPAYPSAYSFSSSFYDEDKHSSGSGPGGHRSSALLHSKSKYSTSSGSPPPSIAQYLKGGLPPYGGFNESSYERVPIREIVSGIARFADLPVRKELPHELSGHSRSSLVERSSTGYTRSSGSGYRRSRSRSRSVSPESRSRSSRFARHGSPSRRDESSHYSSHRDYRDMSSTRERDRDRSESHSHSRVRSSSPGSRDYNFHSRTTSNSTRDNKDNRDYSQNSTTNNTSRKLAPKEEHYYLLDALTKVKKIHKLKLEELEEIKKRDNDKSDSYIYKKVASSVKDIEERIATVERQLEANRKVLGDNYVEVEKTYEEKEKEKKTSTKKSPEEAVAVQTKSTDSAQSQLPEIKKSASGGSSSSTSVTNANSSPSMNELTKDASLSSIVSSASNIEATAETVAKLPKIPKLSAKKPADAEDLEEAIRESTPIKVSIDKTSNKESTFSSKDPTKSTSTFTKTAASKSTSKPESKARTEPSSSSSKSSKTDSKESSKPSSSASSRYGPITEEEIDQVLPYYQWCSMCKNFFESTDEFITHLHRDAHLNGLRTSDFLIIKRAEEKIDAQMLKEEKNQPQQSSLTLNGTDKATANEPKNAIETLGTEFIYPSKAFYCDLCAKFLYTTQQTEMHLHSDKHLTLYKKYLQKNKEYDIKMASQRKSTFRYSYLMRTLIRMKEKGEDIVARVSQEMVRRTRAKEKEREKSERNREKEEPSGKRRKSEPQPSGSENSETKQADSYAEKCDNGDEKVVKKEEESNKNWNEVQLNGGDCKMAGFDEADNGNTADQDATVDKGLLAKEIKEEVDDEPQNAPVELAQEQKEDDEASSTDTIIEGTNDLDNNNDEEFEEEFVEEFDEEYEEVMDVNETNGQEFVEEDEMEVLDGEFVNQLLINLQADNELQKSNGSAGDEDTEDEANQVQNDEVEEEGFDVVDEA